MASTELTTKIILKGMTDPSLSKAFKNAQQLSDNNLGSLKKAGETAKKIAKVGAVAIGTTAVAVAGLGKKSIESYAEYEQLVGGVETLFKDSSDKLIQYADVAYKTAGLSSNEYMSTITSFSAAMINSLGGDTKKATEYSNQAVIDMSDNANKMGTDMESIMNTYQSLSRGQYGMLDNLKLGYGGTKKEMERLLADAEKLTGIKYDISNFGDVTQAIHAIQEQMGITGTTAKEASTTIQGSWSALKGSWANLLTGLADPSQDLGKLINNVFESAGTFFNDNLMPRIQAVLPRIATAISKSAPTIINAISTLIPPLIPPFIDGAVSIMKAIVANLPMIFSALVNAIPKQVMVIAGVIGGIFAGIKILGFVKGIMTVIKVVTTLSKTFGFMKLVLAALGGPVTIIVAVIGALVGAFVALWMKSEKFRNFWIGLWEKIKTFSSQAITAIINFFSKLPSRISNFLSNALAKVVSWGSNLVSKGKQMASKFLSTIVSKMKEIPSKMLSVGLNIVKGLWNGITNAKNWLLGKIKSFAKSITDGIKDFLGIHSPSVVMAKLAKFIPQGIGVGILDNAKYAVNAIKTVGGKMTQTASKIQPAIGAKVQKFGTGGTVTRPQHAIIGDKPETIVPHGNTPRNRSLLMDAARGVFGNGGGGGKVFNFTFAPVINGGNATENKKMLEEEYDKFKQMMDEYLAEKGALAF